MMGETATDVVPAGRHGAPGSPGTARTGPIDTMGFDGQITTASAPAMASSTPGAGRADSAPVEADAPRPATS